MCVCVFVCVCVCVHIHKHRFKLTHTHTHTSHTYLSAAERGRKRRRRRMRRRRSAKTRIPVVGAWVRRRRHYDPDAGIPFLCANRPHALRCATPRNLPAPLPPRFLQQRDCRHALPREHSPSHSPWHNLRCAWGSKVGSGSVALPRSLSPPLLLSLCRCARVNRSLLLEY